jgi:hypothetical protein
MIDYQLIEKNIEHIQQSWENIKTTQFSDLYQLKNIFNQELLNKLQNYLINNKNQWTRVENQEHLNRYNITFCPDTIIEELHIITEEGITPLVNQLFGVPEKNFLGIQIWKDEEGYNLEAHRDNSIIDISLQIYLFDAPLDCGTTFIHKNEELAVPYLHNTGYVYCHTNELTTHKTTRATPPGVTRHSLYSIWSKTAKK